MKPMGHRYMPKLFYSFHFILQLWAKGSDEGTSILLWISQDSAQGCSNDLYVDSKKSCPSIQFQCLVLCQGLF